MINIFKTNKQLRKELKETRDMLEEERVVGIDLAAEFEAEQEKNTATKVIEKVLGEELKWFNLSDKSVDFRREYYREAQNILRSEVFQNETRKYVAQLIDGIAKRAKNFSEVEALRYSINGVEVLKDKLREIPDPDNIKRPTQNDIHSTL